MNDVLARQAGDVRASTTHVFALDCCHALPTLGERPRQQFCVRTVALPASAKTAIDEWTRAADITSGPVFRRLTKSGRVLPGEGLGVWAIWDVVVTSARAIGIEGFGPHDARRSCAKLCRKKGGKLEQIQYMLGHDSIETTAIYTACEQEIAVAVNDCLGL